jgi:uncharacterized membrane protein YfcA
MSFELLIVIAGAFLAAFAVGLAGFADALIASAVWLYVLAPAEAVPLIVATGIVIHLISLVHLRRHVAFDLLWPFLIGGTIGVPFGAWLLRHAEPEPFRLFVGLLLVSYSVFALVAPRLTLPRAGGRGADGTIGLIGGVLGGFAGLSGVVPTVWSGLRGWSKDRQRGVYQGFILVMHAMALFWLATAGFVGMHLLTRFLWCLPMLALGAWAGLKLYGRINEQQFRRLILALLLLSGAALLIY